MRRLDDGWFEAEAPVGAEARYRFRVSPDLAVPDPASRLQAGDVHDPSVVVDLSSQVVVVPSTRAGALLGSGAVRLPLTWWRVEVSCCQSPAYLGEVSIRHLPVLV